MIKDFFRFIILKTFIIAISMPGHVAAQGNDDYVKLYPFVFNGMNEFDTKKLMETINSIDSDQRDDVLSRSTQLISEMLPDSERTGDGRNTIIRTIRGINLNERDNILRIARELLEKCLSTYSFEKIIQKIQNITSDQRENIAKMAKPFIDRKYHYYVPELLDEIIKTDPNDRDDVLKRAQLFCSESKNQTYCNGLITEIRQTKLKERNDVIERVQRFCARITNETYCSGLITEIRQTKLQERDDVIEKLYLINSNICDSDRIYHSAAYSSIIRQIRLVTVQDRDNVIEMTQNFLSHIKISTGSLSCVIKEISSVKPDQRNSVVKLAKDLIAKMEEDLIAKNINAIYKEEIDPKHYAEAIKKINSIRSDQRDDVISKASLFFQDRMNMFDRFNIIDGINTLANLNHGDNIILCAMQLFLRNDTMSGAQISRIIRVLANIPQDECERRVNRALENFNLRPNNHHFIIRLTELLETDLDQPILAANVGMEQQVRRGGYVQGINVHNGNRDRLTANAYKLFILKQKKDKITKPKIIQAYNDLINQINNLDASTKEKVEQALGLNGAKPKVEESFGPLLAGKIESFGLNMDPKELLGRLMVFAQNYVDPRAGEDVKLIQAESLNAQQSIISAILNMFEKDGHLVCNEGKLQRLAVALLQGRLDGVNIDGLSTDMLTTSSAASHASGANAAAKIMHPADTTDTIILEWNKLKETLGHAPTLADVDAFSANLLALKKADSRNAPYNNDAFNATIKAIKESIEEEVIVAADSSRKHPRDETENDDGIQPPTKNPRYS